jgi:capsular exopolysaccharide synthesis family protein
MSRIHDALKKAQEERGSGFATDAGALPGDPAIAAPVPGSGETPAENGIFLGAGTTAGRDGNFLRFDHLIAHCARPGWHVDPNSNVFFNGGLSQVGAEQFRTLRSRLYQMRSTQTQPLRTILVTSAILGEGKTFVTSNLAQSIVRQPDRRALIIDADLRRSRLHVPFGAPSAPGLSDYLQGNADEMAIIQNGQDSNFCLIPGGTEVTNPSELLSNGRLKILLNRITPVFDWVILDSAPCLPVADASILADLCDGVLLVVRAGSTPAETAQRARQEMEGRNVVGVVLNAAKEVDGDSNYYYYEYGNNGKDPK